MEEKTKLARQLEQELGIKNPYEQEQTQKDKSAGIDIKLKHIKDAKKITDKEYAEEIYRRYNESKAIDDSKVVMELKRELAGKRVLLVAPGKSIQGAMREIEMEIENPRVVTIGLNSTLDLKFDYFLTTRKDVYEQAVAEGKNVLVPSNISKGGRGNVRVLNYANWIDVDDRTHDSSAVIALNLLKTCKVSEIILAGFDGFSVDINENYFDPNMRYPVSAEQAERRNAYYKKFINKISKGGISISFMTLSKYMD